MKIKYQWQLLKDEYVRGGWPSVSAFLKEKHFTNNSYTRSRAKGWGIEKTAYIKRVITQTQALSVKSVAEVQYRQATLAQKLQLKGVEGLIKMPIDSCDTARKLVVDGLEQERQCLGLDCKDNIGSTRIDNTSPITGIDKFLEGLSYEDTLMLIAQIKKEKQRRQSKNNVSVNQ